MDEEPNLVARQRHLAKVGRLFRTLPGLFRLFAACIAARRTSATPRAIPSQERRSLTVNIGFRFHLVAS